MLSTAQIKPILGFCASAVKIALGVTQLVAGIALATICSTAVGVGFALDMPSLASQAARLAFKSLCVAGLGLGSTSYGAANILTLGILALIIERFIDSIFQVANAVQEAAPPLGTVFA